MKEIDFPIQYEAGESIDPIHFFHTQYQEIPFIKTFEGVSSKKLYKKWDKEYPKEIFMETYTHKKHKIGRSIFTLTEGVIGYIPKSFSGDDDVQLLYKKDIDEKILAPFIAELKSFFKVKKTAIKQN